MIKFILNEQDVFESRQVCDLVDYDVLVIDNRPENPTFKTKNDDMIRLRTWELCTDELNKYKNIIIYDMFISPHKVSQLLECIYKANPDDMPNVIFAYDGHWQSVYYDAYVYLAPFSATGAGVDQIKLYLDLVDNEHNENVYTDIFEVYNMIVENHNDSFDVSKMDSWDELVDYLK